MTDSDLRAFPKKEGFQRLDFARKSAPPRGGKLAGEPPVYVVFPQPAEFFAPSHARGACPSPRDLHRRRTGEEACARADFAAVKTAPWFESLVR